MKIDRDEEHRDDFYESLPGIYDSRYESQLLEDDEDQDVDYQPLNSLAVIGLIILSLVLILILLAHFGLTATPLD